MIIDRDEEDAMEVLFGCFESGKDASGWGVRLDICNIGMFEEFIVG